MKYLQGYPLPIVRRGGDENEGNVEIDSNLGDTPGWSGGEAGTAHRRVATTLARPAGVMSRWGPTK